jgi:hypothetical protein
MSSTHCVDNTNQVHIRNEDGIEEEHCLDVHEGELSIENEENMPIEEEKEDNLEGTEVSPKTKTYLDTKKCNIEHLHMTVEKFGILVAVQEL